MSFNATDLAFHISLDDQQLDLNVNYTPNGDKLAQARAVTCGPTNQKGAFVVDYQIGFSGKDNFEELRTALNSLLDQINAIDVSEE